MNMKYRLYVGAILFCLTLLAGCATTSEYGTADDEPSGGAFESDRSASLAEREEQRRDAEYQAGEATRALRSRAASKVARRFLQDHLAACDAFWFAWSPTSGKPGTPEGDLRLRAIDAHNTAVRLSGHAEAVSRRNAALRVLMAELDKNQGNTAPMVDKYVPHCSGPTYISKVSYWVRQMSATDLLPFEQPAATAPRAHTADFSGYDAEVARNREASRDYREKQDAIDRRYQESVDYYDRADAQIKADANQRHQEEYQRDQLRNQREMINAVNRQNFQLQKETRQMRDAERQRSTNRNGFRFNMGIFD